MNMHDILSPFPREERNAKEERKRTPMKSSMKKVFAALFSCALVLCLTVSSAFACTTIYAGAALTDKGYTVYGRSEDYSNSQNKLFYVSPAGNHKANELYNGCYGFTFTFTHDSYGYTAFRDDNGDAAEACPDCGQTHAHTPYEAAGTNDQGVTVTATETLGCSDEVEAVDPYEDLGIEEAEIVTVLLSEAATAKEAVDLLLSIYDGAGANAGSGIIIGDANETWYIENVTGHAYIALKLPADLVFVQPNMSIIGLIDLDDTDNVIASENLIAVAQKAGTYVGDADANTINYVASYNNGTKPNARMVNALAYLNTPYDEATGEINYLLSNVSADGAIVPLYTNIKPAAPLTIEDVQNFYKISNIGYQRNLETHIFQVYPEGGALGTVEWVAMNDAAINVFVPYYPMLTTDVDDSYKLSTATATFTEEAPTEGVFYPTTANRRVDGQRVTVEGFKLLPANWQDSFYWSYDALSNLISYTDVAEADAAAALDALAAKQAEINAAFAALDVSGDNAAQAATDFSKDAAAQVHALAVELTNGLLAK